MVETEVVRVTHSMRRAILRTSVLFRNRSGTNVLQVGNAPGHDARDPSLPLQQVRRDPLRALDALEEAAIDGRHGERGCRAEKERERDESVGVGLER